MSPLSAVRGKLKSKGARRSLLDVQVFQTVSMLIKKVCSLFSVQCTIFILDTLALV